MSFIQAPVCLRTEAQHIVFQQTRLPLAQIQLCPCAESEELAVLLCIGKLCALFVHGLLNLSLILAMGYNWKLELSAKVFFFC